MKNSDCIFCKIVGGTVQARKLSEGRHTIAILDASPATLGHTLIIPKTHHEDITTMSKEEMSEIMEQIQLLVPAINTVTAGSAYNILHNTGEQAGQQVTHAHFHIIPRFEDDGFTLQFGKLDLGDEEKDELADQIRDNI